jgi:hypothetical protein
MIKLLLLTFGLAGLLPEFIGPADDVHPHRIFHLALPQSATAPLRNKEEALFSGAAPVRHGLWGKVLDSPVFPIA